MEAIIEIYGNIGFDPWNRDETYTTLLNVQEQFEAFDNPTSITVYINSPGGILTEGYAMYDYLASQNIPVTTIGIGLVASIATVVFLSGNENSRFLRPNTRFFVHNPLPPIGIQTDAEGYEELAARLREEEDELIRFYNTRTNISEERIRNLMNEQAMLTARQAVNIGFSTAIRISNESESPQEIPLVAKYISDTTLQILEIKNKKQDEMNLKERIQNLLNQSDEVVETPVAPVEAQEETPAIDWEAKYKELESSMNQKQEEIENETAQVLAEMQSSLGEKIDGQIELINKLSNRIETLEGQPVTTTKKVVAKIPESNGSSDWDKMAKNLSRKLKGQAQIR